MNREKRRIYETFLKKKGFSKEDIGWRLAMIEHKVNEDYLLEGEKVKLNIGLIEANKTFQKNKDSIESHIIRRNKFIYDNSDTILTIKYDQNHISNPAVICFEEDESRWLFWIGDIIRLLNVKNTFDNLIKCEILKDIGIKTVDYKGQRYTKLIDDIAFKWKDLKDNDKEEIKKLFEY